MIEVISSPIYAVQNCVLRRPNYQDTNRPTLKIQLDSIENKDLHTVEATFMG